MKEQQYYPTNNPLRCPNQDLNLSMRTQEALELHPTGEKPMLSQRDWQGKTRQAVKSGGHPTSHHQQPAV